MISWRHSLAEPRLHGTVGLIARQKNPNFPTSLVRWEVGIRLSLVSRLPNLDLLFNCACFIYIGAWIPFNDFNSEQLSLTPWRLVIIGILVLLLRRLPVVIGLYKWIPDVKTFREALFSGHFGPMGVGAVFIATLASTKLPETVENPTSQVELLAGCIQPIIAFMVLCSIVTRRSCGLLVLALHSLHLLQMVFPFHSFLLADVCIASHSPIPGQDGRVSTQLHPNGRLKSGGCPLGEKILLSIGTRKTGHQHSRHPMKIGWRRDWEAAARVIVEHILLREALEAVARKLLLQKQTSQMPRASS